MALRNLLLVAYHFPPIGGSGVQRAVKLARHLPAAGWRANILTAGHAHYPLIDHSMADGVGSEARVVRCRGLEPGAIAAALSDHLRRRDATPRWLRAFEDRLYWRLDRISSLLKLPEKELLWTPWAAWKALRLCRPSVSSFTRSSVRRQRIEAVVTTSPPIANHLVGLFLKRRLRIPWVMDLRDPVLDNFAYAPISRWTDRYTRWLERTVIHEADHCIVTCPELADRLQDRYPKLPAERVSTITNGYDPADAPNSTLYRDRGRFLLSYVGAFYRQQSLVPVLDAIRFLRAARSDIARLMEFRVVGSIAANQLRHVREEDRDFFHHIGYAEHSRAIEEMAAADAVLLTTPSNDGGRLCIPAKTFEYLAFAPHVIATVHRGTYLWRLLAEAGNTTLLASDSTDTQSLAEAIESRFDHWRGENSDEHRDFNVVEDYRRDRLARRFADIVERCVDGKPRLRLATDRAAVGEEAA